jgi:VanZ family protein
MKSEAAQALKRFIPASVLLFWAALVVVTWGELWPKVEIASPWDKAAHMAAYFILSAWLASLTGNNVKGLLAVGGLLSFSAMLEILQHWTHRDPSLLDVFSNVAGALCGWAAASLLSRRWGNPSESKPTS